nr:MAG TPA: hypothetical protein [Bacteriophage sp.]
MICNHFFGCIINHISYGCIELSSRICFSFIIYIRNFSILQQTTV